MFLFGYFCVEIMGDHVTCFISKHGTESWKPLYTVAFILISTLQFVSPQSSGQQCVLDLTSSPTSNYPSCELGNWGGFLKKNCCGAAFDRYLYALGLRANQTQQIYVSSGEQNACLTLMERFDGDASGCGIDKLTGGGGGCSDFNVTDVVSKMGKQLKRLSEHCSFLSSDGEQDQRCASCVETWEDMRLMHTVATVENSMANNTDICKFAILVSLTSMRIEDSSYVQGIYLCLGKQNSSSENAIKEQPKGKRKLGIGAWVLIGVLIGAVVISIIFIIIRSKRRRKPNSEPKRDAFKDVFLKGPCCPKIPIKEVYTATNNLDESNFIGQGIAGRVYRGIMPNDQHVAIKHIISDVDMETVVREVTSISHVRHPNLVSLLGCCVNEDECFLVYELCPNGNLSGWLFGKDRFLSWIQRLEIAIDSARGLIYLHTYPEGCIVHRDIKPTNILLGPKFEARLSDFGLSKVIDPGEAYVSSEVRGTFGYLDPEYQNNRQVNSSGDVYSFGIVLLQILSGKKVINLNQDRPMPLDKVAKALVRTGSITDFADPKLEGAYSAEAFKLTFQLALSCTGLKQQRPTMEQVAVKLVEALEISTKTKASSPELTPEWLSSSTE